MCNLFQEVAAAPAAGDGGPRDGGRPARRIRHQTHMPVSGMYSNHKNRMSLFFSCALEMTYWSTQNG